MKHATCETCGAFYKVPKKAKYQALLYCGEQCAPRVHGADLASVSRARNGQFKNVAIDRGPEYAIWNAMKTRCSNPNSSRYEYYGGRGIKVCERWANSFEAFFRDMGKRPKGFTIERKDNDGDYEPSNCVWATRLEQAANKRNNRVISHRGKRKILAEWARETGLYSSLIGSRIKRGWTFSKAIKTPPRSIRTQESGR